VQKPCLISTFLLSLVCAGLAQAETIQVPEGGRPVPVGKERVLCGSPPEGWSTDSARKTVQPPASASTSGRITMISVADDAGACARAASPVTMIVTEPWPEIDPASVTLFPDEGRIEYKGQHLDQSQILWQAEKRKGQEACLAPSLAGKTQSCAVPVDRDLPMDTVFRWLPAGAKAGTDVTTYDGRGQRVDTTSWVLRPASIVLGQVFTAADMLDVSQGTGTVAVLHPGSVASVDCGLARCELGDAGIMVRGVPSLATHLTITARLAPRFTVSHGGKSENTASANFTLLRCPLSVVSGPPVRESDESQILVKMDPRCRGTARLRWLAGMDPAEVVREVHGVDADYVLLRTGQLAAGNLTLTVSRADSLAAVIGSVITPTVPPPRPQSTLEIPGGGPINFIPTNREALWSVAGVPHARLVPLDLPGVYTLRTDKGATFLRGDKNGGGFVSLRYGFRRLDLPKEFADVNLAILTESVQRPLREASVPVPFTATAERKEPLAEFICADATGIPHAIPPGRPFRIPYSARNTCHVVIQQQRLSPDDGQQEIVLEVEVAKASGAKKSDASINERMVLHPGGEARSFYLKGAAEQFDQITVRISHVADEARYVLSTTSKQGPPSVQWSATLEGGYARLFVSLTIPAGLYRMNEPVASMTLNFGVLGRLTWLDRQGKEGLLGLEVGVLGASLIPQQDNGNAAFPRTLDTLMGLGLRVDIGQGAAVGVHLWGAYEFRNEYAYTPQGADTPRNATHWSLIFGPSLSIGNVGTNL